MRNILLSILIFFSVVATANAVEYKDADSQCWNPWLITYTGDNLTCNPDNSVDVGDAGAGAGISNVVEDLTPQLGGALDLNGKAIEGAAVFNETGAAVDFRIEGDTIIDLFQIDGINDEVDINGDLNINLPADKNVTIDGRTNPRTITAGMMRLNLTPEAATQNARTLFLDVDANSVPNTQGMHVEMKATGIAAGETIIGVDLVGDTVDSSGGVIRLLEFDKTGVGSAEVHAIHVEPEIEEVIHHASGVFIDPTQGWDENGGFTDTTVAFGSSGTDVTIFDADNDAIYIGAEAVFQEIEVVLDTGASNPGIKPVFEIWTGAAWTTITPVDGTAGFRESGIIDMEDVDLSSWAATTVNAVSKFYLQITRTTNSLGTDPIEDLIQTAEVVDFIWNKDGDVNLSSLSLVDDFTITSETAGLLNLNPGNTGNQTIIDIMPSAALVAGSVWNAIKIDGNALDPLTGAVSDIHALQMDFSSFASADGDAMIHIIHFDYPASDSATGVHSEFAELTNNSTARNIYTDGGALVLSATATYLGHEVDLSNMTRDAGAPVLQGIKVQLPASYTNFGTSYAGFFSGGGESVTLADGVNALTVSGAVAITGALTATSYGGITEANLLDKTAAETLTALYTANANFSIGNAATSAGVLTLLEDTDAGSNFASFQVPALAANTVYTLPPDDGDNTEVLQTNGSGVLTWVANAGGGGGGATTFPIYPYSGKLTGSYVTATIANLDVAVSAGIDAGDGNWRALFDATTDEAMVFYGILPSNYSSTPVVNLIYSMVSGTADEVEWEAAIQCTTPGDAEDIGTETFAAGAVSAVTVPGTAGHTDTLVSITPTDDSCSAKDLIYIYVSTDADDGTNDDATGDRELVGAYGSFTE